MCNLLYHLLVCEKIQIFIFINLLLSIVLCAIKEMKSNILSDLQKLSIYQRNKISSPVIATTM